MSESVIGISPAGRTKVTLGDIARNISENEYKPKEKGLDRCVGLEHLDPGSLRICRWSPITPEMSFTRRFYKGQILFGKRRAYQKKVSLADFDGICSSDILVIEAKKENFVPELLPFILQDDRFFEYAVGTSSGSLSPRTKWKYLAEYEIWLPSLDEQRRSATTLWVTEDCIVNGERFLVEADRVRQVLMRELLTKGIGHTEFKETSVGRLPAEWAATSLKELCNMIKDGTHLPPKRIRNGVPFLSASCIKNGILDFTDNVTYITEKDYDEIHKYFSINLNDVLLTIVGTIGRCAIVKSRKKFSIQRSVACLRPNESIITPDFLYHALNNPEIQKKLKNSANKTAQAGLYLNLLERIKIPIPPLPEQHQITTILIHCDETIAAARANVRAAKTMKMKLINEMLGAKPII